MSHIVSVQTEIRDLVAVQSACQRLRWDRPTVGQFKLFTRSVTGLGVLPPQWRYPIVCDLATGQLAYDNYEGRWGNPADLGRFKQAYAVEKAMLEARKAGRFVVERSLSDGAIELCVTVQGGVE
ncbi:DUF1257 domain-containing protein [Aureliella helgolandensis]|uniref:DUF1257 domain-containing protein n=1 Tax=Aureliella helgolandensis TaxID=2527968 RepID=A0A518G9M1_9BACT|nr:DUF1257 domain-containing protein [Aureliella helgolandensis]QDV25294.1 hypothetical protein Q31a_36180 [Aureliella helgolandensis]